MDSIVSLVQKCKKAGLKLTPQRLAIFKTLENNKTHPTVDSIYQSLKKDFPTMSLTTVYNTLETLYEMGEISKLDIDSDKAHFDPDNKRHHHFQCSSCKKIVDVFVDFSEILNNNELQNSNFTITDFNINFRGVCDSCNKKN
ncbi:transcriptional repressor [bacterium]|nr:transcriptional repressor [bacterium]